MRKIKKKTKTLMALGAIILFILVYAKPLSSQTSVSAEGIEIGESTDLVIPEPSSDIAEPASEPAEPVEDDVQSAESEPLVGDSEDSDFLVSFIDVGQGDSTLIIDNGDVCLIDTGSKDAYDNVINELNRYNITNIDVLILTHPDEDHIGNAKAIIEDYNPRLVCMADVDKGTQTYYSLMQTLENGSINVAYPTINDVLPIGKGMYTFVGPVDYEAEFEDVNSFSLVLKVVYDNQSFLFTGDMTGEEFDLIKATGYNLSADVVKLAHHGSANCGCNSEDFFNTVNSLNYIISCGLYNDYGHPHYETMELLKQRKAYIWRTDLQGTITCAVKNNALVWNQSSSIDFRNGNNMQ